MKLFVISFTILFFGRTIFARLIIKKYDEARWFMVTTIFVRYRKGD